MWLCKCISHLWESNVQTVYSIHFFFMFIKEGTIGLTCLKTALLWQCCSIVIQECISESDSSGLFFRINFENDHRLISRIINLFCILRRWVLKKYLQTRSHSLLFLNGMSKNEFIHVIFHLSILIISICFNCWYFVDYGIVLRDIDVKNFKIQIRYQNKNWVE